MAFDLLPGSLCALAHGNQSIAPLRAGCFCAESHALLISATSCGQPHPGQNLFSVHITFPQLLKCCTANTLLTEMIASLSVEDHRGTNFDFQFGANCCENVWILALRRLRCRPSLHVYAKTGKCSARSRPMALRILAVDDFEPWRRFVSSALQQQLDLQTFVEVSDGLEAVYKAENLRPDLILLDIGLPTLNGIEAASRIRDVSPNSKILFLSEESSPEVAEAALEAGGAGYVAKSDAGRELLPAVKALSEGKRYISAKLGGQIFFTIPDEGTCEGSDRHGLQVYASDASFVEGFAKFIAMGLNSGNAVMVLATEAHLQGLMREIQTRGFSLDAIIKCGSYIPLDVREALSSFMIGDRPDPSRLENTVSNLVKAASKAPNGATRRVLACGECAPILWKQGNPDAALRLEELWDAISHQYELKTLCGYIDGSLQEQENERIFQAISSFHSIVTHCGQND